jgi:hypothetical protein
MPSGNPAWHLHFYLYGISPSSFLQQPVINTDLDFWLPFLPRQKKRKKRKLAEIWILDAKHNQSGCNGNLAKPRIFVNKVQLIHINYVT